MKMMPWPVGLPGIPFHLGIGHRNAGPVRQHAFAVGDDGDIVIAGDLEGIGLERVGLAAARHRRIVRLHEALKPFAGSAGASRPTDRCRAPGGRAEREREEQDNAMRTFMTVLR